MSDACPNPQCGRPIDGPSDRCPRCGTRFAVRHPTAMRHQAPAKPTGYLEIDTGRWRRWMGWLGYLLFFGVVAGAFTLIFVRVSGSWRIAIGVVTFMIAYMVLMGRITGKGLDGGGDQPGMRR